MPHPIGIDLGTTYSCVAVLRDGQVEVLPNDNGNKVTPSVVGFDENGSDTNIVVGEGAVDQQSLNPSNTVYEIKRLIGKEFKDAEVQKDISRWPFKVKCDNDIDPKIQVRYRKEEKLFLPQQVSGMVIKSMRAIAEKALGEEVTEAVITVPAYFNDAQRQATVAAGEIAGLKVLQILNEPTAAAIAYGCQNTVAEPKTYLIYDLGGGTFDVSILKIQKGKFDVLAVNGDCHLGGADFDTALVENVALQIKSKHGVDILKDEKIVAKLRRSCEIAKRRLTANSVASVRVDDIGNGESFEAAITRTRFNELCDRHFQNTLKIVQKALDDAKLQPRNIDGLVLIGGSTRIVKIRELIAAKFPSVSIIQNINPDEAVAYGAAILASKLSQNCEDIVDGVVLDDIEVNDVVPLSLGVQLVGDAMSVLIPRNTRIPYSYTKTYRNAMDSESLDVVIYQGEEKRASNNFLLGEYKLRYPAAKRREIQLKQTFAIDANGIFNVSTKIATTGEVVSKTIDYRQAKLSEDEIAKLVADTAMIEVYDGEAQRCSKLRSTFEAEVYALKSAAEEKKLSSSNAFNNSAKEMCLTFIDWIDSNRDAAYINIDAKYQQFLKRAEEYDACLKFTRLALGK